MNETKRMRKRINLDRKERWEMLENEETLSGVNSNVEKNILSVKTRCYDDV